MMETKLSFSINFNSLLRSAFGNSLLSVYFTLVSMNGTKQHMHLNYNNGNLLLFTLMLKSKCVHKHFFASTLLLGQGYEGWSLLELGNTGSDKSASRWRIRLKQTMTHLFCAWTGSHAMNHILHEVNGQVNCAMCIQWNITSVIKKKKSSQASYMRTWKTSMHTSKWKKQCEKATYCMTDWKNSANNRTIRVASGERVEEWTGGAQRIFRAVKLFCKTL